MMSICADNEGRITGVCPDNLTGGDGWEWMETELTPKSNLTDKHGVLLYKKDSGNIVSRSAAEIEADTPIPKETEEEKLAKAKDDYSKKTTDKQRLDFLAKYIGLTNGVAK